ncbi:HD domain-containing protein [Micromonospora auratinigra]|uniref:HD domain-containing protein n=1 Tax=Micromonospora auratinigra TaxID=261654 RepID=UPI0012FDAF83|nr:ATP-binding protein [Micromonospora auratinigra]
MTAVNSFEKTSLWRRTLGVREDDEAAAERAGLRSAYLQFRAAVEPLAGEIARSMPMFTDHSIAHIDSLWDTASLVCGEDYPLTPAEAFVLGGAFLLHDLGMGLVAYPGGAAAIRADPQFQHTVRSVQARMAEDTGATAEESRASAEEEAIVRLLRRRHAAQAERLVTETFTVPGGTSFHLLQDAALRQSLGPLIGTLAHSHWWGVDEIAGRFARRRGSLPQHPAEWTIDPLKVACVLRLADAAHIDSRRAPTFLHAFRTPPDLSGEHWYFQSRLTRPLVEDDRLQYTSTEPFLHREASAWWLAYETVQMIDGELRAVDSLCADLGKPRFAVRSVAGADSPARFASFVPTDGWQPIDARLRVSQVEHLVGNLGGRYLYGNQPIAAVRELIANASDATRARLAAYGGSDAVVNVDLAQRDGDEWWLTVADNGIGMDAHTLVSSLTDFGRSGWRSEGALGPDARPLADTFEPAGKFGVGFFAIFMLADEVHVTSLKYFDPPQHTHVLDFPSGLKGRPLVRVADEGERLRFGGTVVRARLKHPPTSTQGFLGTPWRNQTVGEELRSTILRLCALAEVDIDVRGPGETEGTRIVRANDWRHIPPEELFERVYQSSRYSSMSGFLSQMKQGFCRYASPVSGRNDETVGRAMMTPDFVFDEGDDLWYYPRFLQRASIYVGGFHADTIDGAVGVFQGYPLKADRFSAFTLAAPDSLRRWVGAQATSLRPHLADRPQAQLSLGATANSFGVVLPDLPCAVVEGRLAMPAEVTRWAAGHDRVLLVDGEVVQTYLDDDGEVVFFCGRTGRRLRLPPDAAVVDMWAEWIYPEDVLPRPRPDLPGGRSDDEGGYNLVDWWNSVGGTGPVDVTVRAVARAWGVDVPGLVAASAGVCFQDEDGEQIEVPFADGGGTRKLYAVPVCRPGTVPGPAAAPAAGPGADGQLSA